MNADAAPIIHMTHIQKQAPGPPRQIAVDTPTMLPVPTLDAVDTINAWKDDTFWSPAGFSFMSRQASPKSLTCANRVLNEKNSPAAASTMISNGYYMNPSTELKKLNILLSMASSW